MQKKNIPYILLLISILFATFLWDKILIISNESLTYGVYKENNYHPINEILRFIFYISVPLTIFFISYNIINKKNCYQVKELFFYKKIVWENSRNKLNYYILILLLLLITLEFISIDFVQLHKKVDHFHDGVYLSASNNFFFKKGLWSSSFVEYGLINFDSIFIWSIFNIKTIGSAKLLKYIYLLLNKGILILIFYNISRLFFLNNNLQTIFFLITSLFSITLVDYVKFDTSEFPLRIFILLLFNFLFLKMLINNRNQFILPFILGLMTVLSILWTLDMGIFINFLLIFILIFFVIRKDLNKIKSISFGVIIGWISLGYFLGYNEIFYLFQTAYLMVTNVDQASGIIYPTPFLSGEARFTKALLIYILSGVLLIIFCLKKDFEVPNSVKIFLISFYISSILVFKQTLTRSDSPHIIASSGISYLIIVSLILFFIFHYLEKNNFSLNFFKKLTKKVSIAIIACTCIFFYSLFVFEINFKNVFLFNKKIVAYIKQENEKFLDEEIIKLVDFYRDISKNETCIQTTTNLSTLPFLVNKPSCTRYFSNWYIVTKGHQEKFINELKNKKPRIILYWSKLDPYNFDDEKRIPLIINYLDDNYKTYIKTEDWHFLKRK